MSVTRGNGGVVQADGSVMSSSCDDIGLLELSVGSADDVSTSEHIGYVLTLVEGGVLPEGLSLSTGMEAIRADGGVLVVTWLDGATDEQDAFGFELDVTAVDEAGNVSEPIRIAVEDDGILEAGGTTEAGCNTSPQASLWASALGLAALRRRRLRSA